MVPASYGGYGYGYAPANLGQALAQGTDFKCVDKAGKPLPICFGIGAANHALLQTLQQRINKFSLSRAFTPLIVDGFIGPLTVAALGRLASDLGADTTTKELVAQNAREIIAQLEALAVEGGEALAPGGEPVQPTTEIVKQAGVPSKAADEVTVSTTAPTVEAADAAVAALPEKKSILPWVLGGAAAVVIVGAVGFAYYRHKATQAAPTRSASTLPPPATTAPKAALGKGRTKRSKRKRSKKTSKRRSRR